MRRAGRYTSVCTSGSSSVVECFLAKEDVAGSTPVSRSNYTHVCDTLFLIASGCACERRPREARYPSGKGEVCKTFMRRFDPDPRLHYFPDFGLDSIRYRDIQFVLVLP